MSAVYSESMVRLYPRQKSVVSSSPVKAPMSHEEGATRQAVTLDRDSISQFFHMPIHDAARHFNICVTSLKKVCRRLGYDRWPYVKPSKMNPHPNRHSAQKLASFGSFSTTSSSSSEPSSPTSSSHFSMANAMHYSSFMPASCGYSHLSASTWNSSTPAQSAGCLKEEFAWPMVSRHEQASMPGHIAGAECVKLEVGGSDFLDFGLLSDGGMDSQFILDFVETAEL